MAMRRPTNDGWLVRDGGAEIDTSIINHRHLRYSSFTERLAALFGLVSVSCETVCW